MNVLSLFDGISCGQVALERAGIKYDNYFASEIDKYATQITEKNYHNTIQLGDVQNWKEWDFSVWSTREIMKGERYTRKAKRPVRALKRKSQGAELSLSA